MRTIIATIAVVCALVGTASGGILFNEDERAHEISFERGSSRVKAQVAPGKAMLFECSQLPCTITLEASGQKLKLTTNEQDIIIKDGKLATSAP